MPEGNINLNEDIENIDSHDSGNSLTGPRNKDKSHSLLLALVLLEGQLWQRSGNNTRYLCSWSIKVSTPLL